MKMYNFKFKLLLVFLITSFVFISCEDSSAIDDSFKAITEDQTIILIESEDISDEVDNIVDDFLNEEFNLTSKYEASKSDHSNMGGRPECVAKTIFINGSSKLITLDFGEGCELPNGHVLTGKIILNFLFNKESKTTTVTQTFDGFMFNSIVVEGEHTIVRTKENEKGNPQSVKTINITLTWPDGESVVKMGNKIREFIEGYDTKTWGDNVFLISGNWAHTFKDGIVYTSKITNSLRREVACRFILSGTIEIVKANRTGTIDFGDGTCDNIATFTNSEGLVTEITLRKRINK
jgi:hypothetical protein